MTNLAGETIDARCVDSVYIYTYIYIEQVFDLMADRLADGPTGLAA
jgi:hypothetical protein